MRMWRFLFIIAALSLVIMSTSVADGCPKRVAIAVLKAPYKIFKKEANKGLFKLADKIHGVRY
ncbi:hypothetical protein BOX15_Mlig011746g1 [Macrostomum lignano]|uniref:NTR domain-containing protein n=2 Tax=Macrostomum lignano TaxID=282301 RepID=A0A1I8IU74_9PLAT|nr:hypothetical protein BOX15_Mlig011746g2 [Macrostomum lignano]PAA78406.1 hypothetical protein BOX15_Mlig011746g3 [Macrostomum lignano]PAA90415.1 hypothetical protein BOX15_Mlig011746g1 [Macrostomum lignano]